MPQYTLLLLSASSHDVVSAYEVPYAEVVTSLKVMSLEVSEHTRERKLMVAVGSASQRGEDAPAKGVLTIFDISGETPTRLFQFKHPFSLMLYASPPAMHPSKPLVVWPLGGGELLFADFVEKTFFTRKLHPSARQSE